MRLFFVSLFQDFTGTGCGGRLRPPMARPLHVLVLGRTAGQQEDYGGTRLLRARLAARGHDSTSGLAVCCVDACEAARGERADGDVRVVGLRADVNDPGALGAMLRPWRPFDVVVNDLDVAIPHE